MNWPDHYPDGCPPNDAQPADGVVFRLVQSNPPSPDDFVPTIIKVPSRDYTGKECMSSGLTVFKSQDGLARLKARVPYFRNHFPAKGLLEAIHGVLKGTAPDGHHTWWVPENVSPYVLFSVVNYR